MSCLNRDIIKFIIKMEELKKQENNKFVSEKEFYKMLISMGVSLDD